MDVQRCLLNLVFLITFPDFKFFSLDLYFIKSVLLLSYICKFTSTDRIKAFTDKLHV